MKFLCEQCQAKYQIADEKAAGKTVRMKCRKCGHLIEVRATVVEGPDGTVEAHAAAPVRPSPQARTAVAGSLASAKAPAAARPQDKPAGALARAFRSNVQRDDEVSAPIDMTDLSAADEWYVAINGVPVGPIRIAEVRRKAALGAVTEESLCWQEGLEEWRALRSFPELAAIVREAATGRSTLAPPEARHTPAPPPPRASARPPAPAGPTLRAPAPRPVTGPVAPAARSNVVPITSRLATAEKLAEPPSELAHPGPQGVPPGPFGGVHAHSVVPDPFGSPPQPPHGLAPVAPSPPIAPMTGQPAGAVPFAPRPSLPSGADAMPTKKAPPWMAIAMVAAAGAFGVTAAIAIFLRPGPAPAQVVVQVPAASSTVPESAPSATATSTTDTRPTATAGGSKGSAAMGVPRSAATAVSPSSSLSTGPAHGLDLHSISPGSNVLPTDEPSGGDTTKATAGQGLSSAQVSQVVGLHQVSLRRNCWERNPSQKMAVNVSVTFTVAGDGSVQGASASGDEPSIATCIANDVKGWHFPATGTSQPVNVPFHFVRQ